MGRLKYYKNNNKIYLSLSKGEFINKSLKKIAKELEIKAKDKGVELLLPTDVVLADSFSPEANSQISSINSIPEGLKSLDAKMISLGVSNEYFNINDSIPSVTPKALVTTNPLIGMDWLIDIWVKNIHTKLPWAELHIFSMTMYNGIRGNKVGEKYVSILEKLKNNLKYNIHVNKPKIDSKFKEEIKDMRVHLYPSHNYETSALTLMESQVLGIPAVVRPLGAATEKIVNGKTGFVAQNDNEFSEYSIRLMSDSGYYKRISDQAKEINDRNNWEIKANDFIKIFEIGLSK